VSFFLLWFNKEVGACERDCVVDVIIKTAGYFKNEKNNCGKNM